MEASPNPVPPRNKSKRERSLISFCSYPSSGTAISRKNGKILNLLCPNGACYGSQRPISGFEGRKRGGNSRYMPARNAKKQGTYSCVKGTLSFQKCVESRVQTAYSYKDFFENENALREATVASKGFEPLCDRMKLGAYKKACILDRNE